MNHVGTVFLLIFVPGQVFVYKAARRSDGSYAGAMRLHRGTYETASAMAIGINYAGGVVHIRASQTADDPGSWVEDVESVVIIDSGKLGLLRTALDIAARPSQFLDPGQAIDRCMNARLPGPTGGRRR